MIIIIIKEKILNHFVSKYFGNDDEIRYDKTLWFLYIHVYCKLMILACVCAHTHTHIYI